MTIYQIWGSDYDDWHLGNHYFDKQLAELEATYLNKCHASQKLVDFFYNEVVRKEELDLKERYKISWNMDLTPEQIIMERYIELQTYTKYKFFYEMRNSHDPGMFVRVREVEVLETIPQEYLVEMLKIKEALI